jgi:hypothetical protein
VCFLAFFIKPRVTNQLMPQLSAARIAESGAAQPQLSLFPLCFPLNAAHPSSLMAKNSTRKAKGKLPEDGAEVIPAGDARAAGWHIFDNAACRRMIPFLNPSVIIKSKPNTLLPILHGVQTCVVRRIQPCSRHLVVLILRCFQEEFHTKKPQASDDLIAFIHMLSKCTMAAVEQFKPITEQEFGVLCRKFPNPVRRALVRLRFLFSFSGF